MKTCASCGELRPLEAFHRHGRRADGRQTVCKECKRAYNADYYAANADRHKSMRAQHRTALRADVEALLADARDRPCADCGRRYPPEAMDFDHVRGEKSMDITGMRRHGRERVRAEIEKCDVVCVNCHRRRTRRRRLEG